MGDNINFLINAHYKESGDYFMIREHINIQNVKVSRV